MKLVEDIKSYIKSLITKYYETKEIDMRYLEHRLNELYEVYDSLVELLQYFIENQVNLTGYCKCIDRDYEEYEYSIETDYGNYEIDTYQQEYLTELYDYGFWR